MSYNKHPAPSLRQYCTTEIIQRRKTVTTGHLLSSFSFSCSGSLHSPVFRSAVLTVYTLQFFVQLFWKSTRFSFSFSCSGSLHSPVFRSAVWRSTLSRFSFSCSGSLHSPVFRSAVLAVYTLQFFVQLFWQSKLYSFSFSCSGSLHFPVFRSAVPAVYTLQYFSAIFTFLNGFQIIMLRKSL